MSHVSGKQIRDGDHLLQTLRNIAKEKKKILKVDINTDLYNLIDFLSRGWHTADKPAILPKQKKLVELLLTHYLTDRTDEAIEVLSIYIERMDNWHKATQA